MDVTTPNLFKTTVWILASALGLGVLGDLVLRAGPWGLNASLWTLALALLLSAFARKASWPADSGRRALIPAIVFFGLLLAWRDSEALKMLDILAIGAVLVAVGTRTGVATIWQAPLAQFMLAGVDIAFGVAGGALPIVGSRTWREGLGAGDTGEKHTMRDLLCRAQASVIGLALAVPLVLVFGLLFSAADPAFAAVMRDLFTFKWHGIYDHGLVIAVIAWVSAGLLRVLVQRAEVGWITARTPEWAWLSTSQIAIPLGALNALFLLFLAVQARYLFGGEALVAARTGLTYAEYARQGFSQLVTVSALTLAVLLAADWLHRPSGAKQRRVFRWLAVVLVAQVYVVMVSAVHRMRMYQEAYGLTELRVYTMAFMLWLAVVFVWFMATVLTGQRERFAFGAFMAGLAFVVGLHAYNPDARIAQVNLTRAAQGHNLDVNYAAALSADAVPALVAGLPALDVESRRRLLTPHRERLKFGAGDWRAWSWARWRARNMLDTVQMP